MVFCVLQPPSLNPARALGPAFVLHKWESHWVFWFGPLLGGLMAGMLYEFILNPRRMSDRNKGSSYGGKKDDSYIIPYFFIFYTRFPRNYMLKLQFVYFEY